MKTLKNTPLNPPVRSPFAKSKVAFGGFILALGLLSQTATMADSAPGIYSGHPIVAKVKRKMLKYGYTQGELDAIFSRVKRYDSVLKAMKNPAEFSMTWERYRKIFLKPDRVQAAVRFWQQHRRTLERVSHETGVPEKIILAIIGVETKFGQNTGKHPVLDSLTSLAVDFPRRSKFFTSELEQYLRLCKENNFNPHAIKGSYAGAMGLGQFIASSYRRYAKDYTGDGKADLWNPNDAIASVANYFKRHGWKPGQSVATPVKMTTTKGLNAYVITKARKMKTSPATLRAKGLDFDPRFNAKKAAILKIDKKLSDGTWVVGQNFYVITRYNHSAFYGMAVHQLSNEIERAIMARR